MRGIIINNYIWIFGENHGNTTNNNSYYFWKKIVNIKDDIDKDIIFNKNDNTLKTYDSLSQYEKKFVIWKNSHKHFKLFSDADMFFVTLSYKDITPNKLYFKEIKYTIKKPVIYLRHGTTGMKRTYYKGNSYWNNLFRFLTYNPDEVDYLIKNNNFSRYQIYQAEFHPRYGEFIRRDEYFTDKKQILWFLTWREYFDVNSETASFINNIQNVLKSPELKEYLKNNDLVLKLCVHQFFDRENYGEIYKLSEKGLIEIVHSKDVDVMDELAKSKLLITDYSSVAYDFAFLNRPVLLYQPDLEVYSKTRDFFCEIDDMKEHNIENPQELIHTIINGQIKLNPFFRDNWPSDIDYEYIKNEDHIVKMYEYFADIQRNKITILGLNFFEYNEMVNSTMSLAENLLNEGYLVETISLLRQQDCFNPPNALNRIYLYWKDTVSKKEKLSRKKYSLKSNYGDLKYDNKIDLFHPSIPSQLDKLMKNIRSNTVISTRHSLHLYLDKCSSSKVKNKIYYFSSPLDDINENYNKLLDKIKKTDIGKSIFLSKKDVEFYENNLNFKTPSSKLIYEPGIIENQFLDMDFDSDFIDENYKLKEIDTDTLIDDENLMKEYNLLKLINIDKKDFYTGLYLVSFSEYYSDELNEIIEFGKYLKENNIENIKIDIIGKGDYSPNFIQLIAENDLSGYVNIMENNLNILHEIRSHDFILNLSKNPNHPMFYLLGVFNYKKVFCIENDKSSEIFADIPNTFIESYEWLCNQIPNLYKLSFKDFDDYANMVKNNYINEDMAKKLLEYIEK